MPDSYLVVVGIRSFQEHSKLSPREGDTVISGDKIDNDIIRCFDQKSQVSLFLYIDINLRIEKGSLYLEAFANKVPCSRFSSALTIRSYHSITRSTLTVPARECSTTWRRWAGESWL